MKARGPASSGGGLGQGGRGYPVSRVRGAGLLLLSLAPILCVGSTGIEADDWASRSAEEKLAFSFLKSLPREWSGTSDRDCKTYEDKNIDRLSPPFVLAAAAFLRAFVAVHGHVTLTSAHRDEQEQSCVCEGEKGPCAGRPRVVK